jgi:hypothetical protein
MAPPRKKAAAKRKPYDLKKAAETNRLALSPDEQWAEDICAQLDIDYHPWQVDADADPSKRITLLWGRGVGKTSILRARALKKMVRRRGAAIAYVCTSKPTARRLNWNPLKALLFALGLSDEFSFHETRMECMCIRTGSVYYFIGADDVAEVEKLRGQPFDEVQIDECASHDNELLEYMLDECVAPRLGERDGVIVLAGTPGHVLRGRFYDATRPGSDLHRPYRERDGERWIGWSSHSCELLDVISLPDADRYPAMQKNWATALEEKERNQWGDDNPKWLREYRRRWARNDTTNMYSAYRAFAEDGKTRLNSWDPLDGKTLDLVTMLAVAVAKLPSEFSDWVFGYGQDLGARDPYALDIFALSPSDERRRKFHVGWFDRRKMGPGAIANVLIGTEAADLARRGQVYTELGGAFGVTGWPVAIVADLAGLGETIIDELAKRLRDQDQGGREEGEVRRDRGHERRLQRRADVHPRGFAARGADADAAMEARRVRTAEGRQGRAQRPRGRCDVHPHRDRRPVLGAAAREREEERRQRRRREARAREEDEARTVELGRVVRRTDAIPLGRRVRSVVDRQRLFTHRLGERLTDDEQEKRKRIAGRADRTDHLAGTGADRRRRHVAFDRRPRGDARAIASSARRRACARSGADAAHQSVARQLHLPGRPRARLRSTEGLRMTKTASIQAMPVKLADDQHELAVQIREPGVVRSVGFALERRLVMAQGQPQFNEVLTMFLETSMDGPLRNRRFAVLATGQSVSCKDGHKLTFIGTAISSNTGRIAHIYEVTEVA